MLVIYLHIKFQDFDKYECWAGKTAINNKISPNAEVFLNFLNNKKKPNKTSKTTYVDHFKMK